MQSWDSKSPILAFFCNWAPYRCYMDLCHSDASLPHAIYPIKVMCAGRVDPAMVLFAFERGAEGVMVVGCKEKECRYGPGPAQADKMATSIRGLMHVVGLEPNRFSIITFSFDEKDRLFEEMNMFVEKISELGTLPFASALEGFKTQPPQEEKNRTSLGSK
jgi:coenzyme F420-reducing hydrogenase delta subunit